MGGLCEDCGANKMEFDLWCQDGSLGKYVSLCWGLVGHDVPLVALMKASASP